MRWGLAQTSRRSLAHPLTRSLLRPLICWTQRLAAARSTSAASRDPGDRDQGPRPTGLYIAKDGSVLGYILQSQLAPLN
jgi:hypothetical protein